MKFLLGLICLVSINASAQEFVNNFARSNGTEVQGYTRAQPGMANFESRPQVREYRPTAQPVESFNSYSNQPGHTYSGNRSGF